MNTPLCVAHGKPILPSKLRDGSKTRGCSSCTRKYRQNRAEKNLPIPPPNKRLCKTHKEPITLPNWKVGHRTTGCRECERNRKHNPKIRKQLNEKWINTFISCVNHPNRRCNRSYYVCNRARICGSCISRVAGGSFSRGYIRRHRRSGAVRAIRESQMGLRGRPNAIKTFAAIVGLREPDLNFPRR